MPFQLTNEEEAPAQLWKSIYGFADSLVLRAAVELRIPDIVLENGGPITLIELASKLQLPNTDSDRLHRIMRFLVHMEIFSEQISSSQVQYRLLPAAGFLLRNAKQSSVASLLGATQKHFMLPWHYMKDGLGNGGVAFEKALGMTLWDYLDAHPDDNKLFNESMASDTTLSVEFLVNDCVDIFQGIESLVDVGGGNGATIKAISTAFPHLKCTVFDLPHVIQHSPDIPGIERVAGDMLKSVPSAQAILLKFVLTDWSDEYCVKILKKCKDAVPSNGGKVIIVDMVLDEESQDELSKVKMALDIDMLVNTGGRVKTAEDWKNLIEKAGYRGCNIRHMDSMQPVIEAFPH